METTAASEGTTDSTRPNAARRGRPTLDPASQRTVVVKTLVTPAEKVRLREAFHQASAARRLTFAEFLRQRLLAGGTPARPPRRERLDGLLLLDECRQALLRLAKEQPAPAAEDRLERMLSRLETTLNEVTEWWYAS